MEPAVELAASGVPGTVVRATLRTGMHWHKAAIGVLLDLELQDERRSDVATE